MSKPSNPKLYAKARAIVKARVKKWPSAYASGQLVQQYKKMGGKYSSAKASSMSRSEKKTATARKRKTNPSGGGKKPTYART